MPGEWSMLTQLVVISLVLQVVALFLALRLGQRVSRPWPWYMVTMALVLMASRRAVSLNQALSHVRPLDPTAETIAFAISLLLLLGMIGLHPVLARQTVSERDDARRREEAQAVDARFRQLVEAAREGVWILDPQGTTTYVNRQMAGMLGETPESMRGRPVFEFTDAAGRAVAEQNLARRAQGVGEQHEFRFRTRDGRLIDGLVSSNPIQGPAGEYLGAVAFVTDLTERNRASETLARSERHYRTLVELTGTGYVIIDLQGRVLDANAEYVRLAGHGRLEELLGRSVVEWTAEYDRARNAREVEASLPRGGVTNLEVDYRHPDGRIIPVLINAAIIDDPERGKVFQALCRDMSSRRAAEQALRESEDRYALSVEGASAGIWDWDVATGTVFYSPQWKALVGYRPEELADDLSTWERLLHPDDRAQVRERVRLHFAERTPYVVEYRLRARDGSWRWFVAHGQARWNAQGQPVRMAGSTIDITGQKLAERALTESEERLRRLAEQSDEVFWYAQLEPERMLYLSPAFEQLWGLSVAEVTADPRRRLAAIHPEDRERIRAAWESVIRPTAEGHFDVEYRVIRPDGTVRWVHDRASLLRDDAGRPSQVCGIAGDITDRKLAEARIREANRQLQSLIDAAPLPIVALDPAGVVTRWNPAAEVAFGWTAREILGQRLPIVPDELEEEFRQFREEVGDHGGGFRGRLTRRRHRDGRDLEVMISTAPLRNPEGKMVGLVAIYEDVTERRRVERVSRQLQERLVEAQKLESLGVLAGGIAHDFNNLLTLILGNTHLARSETTQPGPAQEALREIEQATHRATELTAQMLAYAGKGRFIIGPVDLGTLVRDAAALLEAAVPPGARLQVEVPASLPAVEGDPAQLRQVLTNLLTNAGEALSEGSGTITIRAGAAEVSREELIRTMLPQELVPGRYLRLEVQDDGTGMTAEVQQRIFEPFFSTRFAGRGLGLPAVLGIVRRHRGTVQIESRPGQGTRVSVYLPLAAPQRALAPTGTAGGGDLTAMVLVVDDEEDVLRLTRRLLERNGLRVLTAGSGEEALARFRERRTEIGAVVLDLTMPGMGGDEALGAIRALDREIPVILMSGYSEEEVARRCGVLELTAFLPKPYLPAELIDEVRRALRADRPRPAGNPARESR